MQEELISVTRTDKKISHNPLKRHEITRVIQTQVKGDTFSSFTQYLQVKQGCISDLETLFTPLFPLSLSQYLFCTS